jgi:hypothetical protein
MRTPSAQGHLLTKLEAILLIILLVPLGSWAHREHGFWTEVVWAGTHFEISHRLHLADAIVLLQALDPEEHIDSIRGQALLAIHVEENFSMNPPDVAGSIATIGAEIDDDFIFIYQEWHGAKPNTSPTFSHTAIFAAYPDAEARVRYQIDGTNEVLRLPTASP